VDQTVTQTPGTVKRLSVAVLVDSSVKGIDDASLRQLVSAAAGLQPSRGDTISLVRMPFSNAAATQAKAAAAAAASAQRKAEMTNILKSVAPALVVLVALALLARTLRRPRSYPVAVRPALALEPGGGPSGSALPGGAAMPGLAGHGGAPELSQAVGGATPIRVEDFIEQQPDQVARLLRGWMSDKVGSEV